MSLVFGKCWVGMDPGLNNFAVVGINEKKEVILMGKSSFDARLTLPQKGIWLARWLERLLSVLSEFPAYTCIEGLAYSNRSSSSSVLAGVEFVVRMFFAEKAISYGVSEEDLLGVVPPTEIKKFITGKGTADKGAVQKCVWEKFGYRFKEDHYADAFALALIALEHWKRHQKGK